MTNTESKILDGVQQKAYEAELRYHICSRCTLYGLKQYFDFIPDDAVRAITPLAGGGGRCNGSCGTYSAGLLAIGFKFSPPIEDLSEEGLAKAEISLQKQLAFRDSFLKEFGSILCPDVQERIFGRRVNFMNEKEGEEFANMPGHYEGCGSVVGKAARLAAEILLEIK